MEPRREGTMRYPWANTALLLLLVAMVATGLVGLVSGEPAFGWALWLHGVGGYAMLAALVWKARIIGGVLRRRPALTPSRLAVLLLTGLLLATLATGYLWTYGGRRAVGDYSLMVVHGALATALLLPLLWHLLARRAVFRVRAARDRRALLRLAGLGAVGLLLRPPSEGVRAALALPGAGRRFTGSYETGSLTGQFPEVAWLFDNPAPVDAADWRLTIEGEVARPLTLGYDDLAALPGETATELIDCTGGWYSTQAWDGVRLGRLLALAEPTPAALSVTVESITGYGRRFALAEAADCLLALRVAGEPLTHGHGAPLRLVAPGRRGYDWVKWVARLRVNADSALLQPPLPLQ
jgi:DMSO/TMAO reductase YedYZ molybdopterin-dependent catalytic subunit